MKERILVVDDEQDICEILKYNLETAGYEAVTAFSAEDALEHVHQCNLLLLDVMLPGISGFELASLLKSREDTAHIPIIFLTARDTVNDTVEGLNIGADDYVSKPFSVKEVLARVKAVLRRTPTNRTAFEGLMIDLDAKTVTINGETVELTKTEFDLLHLLLTHREQVFSRKQLMELIWSGVVVADRTIDVNITRLRKKIGPYAHNIATRQGFGYYFDERV